MTLVPEPRRRRFGLYALAGVAVVVSLLGYVRAERADDAQRFYLRNTGGAVVFTHAGHAAEVGACVVCHHDLAVDLVADCSDCHDDGFEAGMLEHADLVSIDGHQCDSCHEVAPDSNAQGCRECHDGSELADLYHTQCHACHASVASQRFELADGSVRCEACHLD